MNKESASAIVKKEVLVLDPDARRCRKLCELLSDHNYKTIAMNSLENVYRHIEKYDCRAIILNLDNIPVSNRTLSDLKSKKPSINIVALSKRQFHPELEEALREYISVCFAQPLDSDELIYWLNSIFCNKSTEQS